MREVFISACVLNQLNKLNLVEMQFRKIPIMMVIKAIALVLTKHHWKNKPIIGSTNEICGSLET